MIITGHRGESHNFRLEGSLDTFSWTSPVCLCQGLQPRKAEGLILGLPVLQERTSRWVCISPILALISLPPLGHCCLKAVPEPPNHTSSHSPVIQTYSQGCRLQLSVHRPCAHATVHAVNLTTSVLIHTYHLPVPGAFTTSLGALL